MPHQIEAFYDPTSHNITYVVFDTDTRDAIIIDPVLDYNPVGSQTSLAFIDKVFAYVEAEKLKVNWVLETHAHADHFSAAQLLKDRLGAKLAIGKNITLVQQTFKGFFDLPDTFATDGSQFDKLLSDGEVFQAGSLHLEAIATPGHTPACMSYKIGNDVFVGDALFMPDYGTGRCDFPKGSAEDMYTSVQEKLYTMPDDTRIFVGHDYQPTGRKPAWESTIGESKRSNPQIRAETTREEFVAFRSARDATLAAPKLLFQSVQVNIDGGRLPKASANGMRYLTLPLNAFHPTDDLGQPKKAAAAE